MWIISPALAISDFENYNEETASIEEIKWDFEFNKKDAEIEDTSYYEPRNYTYSIQYKVRPFDIIDVKLLN
jgi:hypothetical protein